MIPLAILHDDYLDGYIVPPPLKSVGTKTIERKVFEQRSNPNQRNKNPL